MSELKIYDSKNQQVYPHQEVPPEAPEDIRGLIDNEIPFYIDLATKRIVAFVRAEAPGMSRSGHFHLEFKGDSRRDLLDDLINKLESLEEKQDENGEWNFHNRSDKRRLPWILKTKQNNTLLDIGIDRRTQYAINELFNENETLDFAVSNYQAAAVAVSYCIQQTNSSASIVVAPFGRTPVINSVDVVFKPDQDEKNFEPLDSRTNKKLSSKWGKVLESVEDWCEKEAIAAVQDIVETENLTAWETYLELEDVKKNIGNSSESSEGEIRTSAAKKVLDVAEALASGQASSSELPISELKEQDRKSLLGKIEESVQEELEGLENDMRSRVEREVETELEKLSELDRKLRYEVYTAIEKILNAESPAERENISFPDRENINPEIFRQLPNNGALSDKEKENLSNAKLSEVSKFKREIENLEEQHFDDRFERGLLRSLNEQVGESTNPGLLLDEVEKQFAVQEEETYSDIDIDKKLVEDFRALNKDIENSPLLSEQKKEDLIEGFREDIDEVKSQEKDEFERVKRESLKEIVNKISEKTEDLETRVQYLEQAKKQCSQNPSKTEESHLFGNFINEIREINSSKLLTNEEKRRLRIGIRDSIEKELDQVKTHLKEQEKNELEEEFDDILESIDERRDRHEQYEIINQIDFILTEQEKSQKQQTEAAQAVQHLLSELRTDRYVKKSELIPIFKKKIQDKKDEIKEGVKREYNFRFESLLGNLEEEIKEKPKVVTEEIERIIGRPIGGGNDHSKLRDLIKQISTDNILTRHDRQALKKNYKKKVQDKRESVEDKIVKKEKQKLENLTEEVSNKNLREDSGDVVLRLNKAINICQSKPEDRSGELQAPLDDFCDSILRLTNSVPEKSDEVINEIVIELQNKKKNLVDEIVDSSGLQAQTKFDIESKPLDEREVLLENSKKHVKGDAEREVHTEIKEQIEQAKKLREEKALNRSQFENIKSGIVSDIDTLIEATKEERSDTLKEEIKECLGSIEKNGKYSLDAKVFLFCNYFYILSDSDDQPKLTEKLPDEYMESLYSEFSQGNIKEFDDKVWELQDLRGEVSSVDRSLNDLVKDIEDDLHDLRNSYSEELQRDISDQLEEHLNVEDISNTPSKYHKSELREDIKYLKGLNEEIEAFFASDRSIESDRFRRSSKIPNQIIEVLKKSVLLGNKQKEEFHNDIEELIKEEIESRCEEIASISNEEVQEELENIQELDESSPEDKRDKISKYRRLNNDIGSVGVSLGTDIIADTQHDFEYPVVSDGDYKSKIESEISRIRNDLREQYEQIILDKINSAADQVKHEIEGFRLMYSYIDKEGAVEIGEQNQFSEAASKFDELADLNNKDIINNEQYETARQNLLNSLRQEQPGVADPSSQSSLTGKDTKPESAPSGPTAIIPGFGNIGIIGTILSLSLLLILFLLFGPFAGSTGSSAGTGINDISITTDSSGTIYLSGKAEVDNIDIEIRQQDTVEQSVTIPVESGSFEGELSDLPSERYTLVAMGGDSELTFPLTINAQGFTYNPAVPEPGQSITFNASGNLADSNTLRWNMGDDTMLEGGSIQHSYDTPGEYSVELSVINEGNITATTHQTVVVLPTLSADFETRSQSPVVGEEIEFDAGSSKTRIGGLSYQWDLGDNTTETGEVIQHSYDSLDEYTIQLTVIDEAGNRDTTEIQLDVGANTNSSSS
ncbi:PKD domain-containing protein [Halovenus aranensis]|uniref:PKD domain-containing protein n=1 Tax=Halovenus aranensis TaxID=890420 RepID=A0A1G8ZFH2_9EURY|nr:PKD domain-containing protein [Halovenus aranensis]SDK12920.1 PKD domain-containing protein [Halovenus aranensis]